ncbi:MAG: CCA tRNA nucleotidyltransferase [Hyphomicrobium aestuarii]|nr:CCA tRNA nucleotidyltransferase [Hyphomicrobium aestuarii]
MNPSGRATRSPGERVTLSARGLDTSWLDAPATQAVFQALSADGHTARAVGGTVRNALLCIPITDIDLATDATPSEVLALAARAGLKTVPTGLSHGTVTVFSGGVPVEVTTLRRDVATDGRHAEVAFTDDWAADAARRDFTVNAIYCDADGTIFDPLGGIADLDPVQIRFIGDATARIREDFLRILRFFRFSAALSAGGALDEPGLIAASAERGGLARISGERIASEFAKLMVAAHAVPVVWAMAHSGVMAAATGIDSRPDVFERVVEIEAVLSLRADPILRLAALFISKPADVAVLGARLKPSSRDLARLALCADAGRHGISPALDETSARALCYRLGADAYRDAVIMTLAQSAAHTAALPGEQSADHLAALRWRQLAALAVDWPIPVFPVSGGDIVTLGVPAGRMVGEILSALEASFIHSDFSLSRMDLLEQAEHLARNCRR